METPFTASFRVFGSLADVMISSKRARLRLFLGVVDDLDFECPLSWGWPVAILLPAPFLLRLYHFLSAALRAFVIRTVICFGNMALAAQYASRSFNGKLQLSHRVPNF